MKAVPAWLLIVLTTAAADQTHLAPLQSLGSKLEPAGPHEYFVALQAGQFARVEVEQHSVNVAIEVFEPQGKHLVKADHLGIGSPDVAEWIAEVPGNFRIRVQASDPNAPAGSYEIAVRDIAAATPQHRHRIAAASLARRVVPLIVTGNRDDTLTGIDLAKQSLKEWQGAGDLFEQARSLYWIGLLYVSVADRDKALDYAQRGLETAKQSGDPRAEAWALDSVGFVFDNFGDKRKALEYYEQALPLMRANSDRVGEANTTNHIGAASMRLGDKRKALSCYRRAAEIFREVQDHYRHAAAVNNEGVAHDNLGEFQSAVERYREALALRRALKNRSGEAQTLSNLALVYLKIGEYQEALGSLEKAIEINRSLNDRWYLAVNLHNVARVYSTLGDRERALQHFQEALAILREVKDQWGLAHALTNIGEVYADRGEYRKALEFHTEALGFARAVGDRDTEATALHRIGECHAKLGDLDKARDHLEQALNIHRATGNKRLLARDLASLGAVHRKSKDHLRALHCLDESLAVSRTIGDRLTEGEALGEIARVDADRGDILAAHRNADAAISLFESLRQGVLSPKLGAHLFATVQRLHLLNLEVLARLHAKRPSDGYDAAGVLALERARARSLLELLAEARTELRNGVDAALLAHERALHQHIAEKAEQQVRLLSGKHTPAEAAAAKKDLVDLATRLDQVQSRIRQASPEYAGLTRPVPLDLNAIQTSLLDENTILLEYALGEQKSFLWAITSASVDVFELPGRAEIDVVVKHLYDLLTARNRKPANESTAARVARISRADLDYPVAAARASRILLGAIASRIANKRLLIVAEGSLHYLPFAALPDPCGGRAPLAVHHEIVTAPSASVLAAIRQQKTTRQPARNTLLVLADPVFSARDMRVPVSNPAGAASDYERLRFSRMEAEAIARLAPADSTVRLFDFEASRETLLRSDIAQYRILHFATHGLVNQEHPELSGVVLSLVDRAGRSRNGFLRLYDIYNLKLNADLVVLSACRTGVGGEIAGEGLIGLTRGFLYAGAPRVVATLWAIDDRATVEVMERIYQGLLRRGERPAAALRAAQTAMWRSKGWIAPYYWAAFTLHGDWK